MPASEAEGWPWDKVAAALPGGSTNGLAVLVTTGAMNPIHAGHIQMLHQVRIRAGQLHINLQ